jgi:hypothetical protein
MYLYVRTQVMAINEAFNIIISSVFNSIKHEDVKLLS